MSSVTEAGPCPKCGVLNDNFIKIDAGMRLSLNNAGEAGEVPEKVCASCFDKMAGHVSQGLKLRMERELREKNKMMMWKNRVHLIKNARGLMSQKAYSEAAVQYEKYLRVLEVVHNKKKGELSPAIFNNSNRSKELTVVASVYWDLMRIYDTSPRYGERMGSAARKCSEFLPFSTIYPDIVKKAELFQRTSKNPAIMRQFLRLVKSRRGPCFVADAAFNGQPYAVELTVLRAFRDEKLRRSHLGRRMIYGYYRISPPVARWIGQSQLKSRAARWLLTRISHVVKSL